MEPILFIFIIVIFILSVIIHEVAHGTVADYLGDPTAKHAGRLTLNPLKHLDPVGSVLLPLFLFILTQTTGVGIIFGWAKPVPVTPANFRDKKYGDLKVSIAGPASNLIIALFFGLAMRFVPVEIFITAPNLMLFFSYITAINIMIAVFNLVPIPPLDGSHILFTFLPRKFAPLKIFLNQFGFMILLFLIYFASSWLYLALSWIFRLITGFPM